MWMNENNNEIVKTPKPVTVNGVMHPKEIFTKWSESELNAIGIYKLTVNSRPSRRYFTSTEFTAKVGNTYITDYNITPVDLTALKSQMLRDLSEAFKKYSTRPRITSSLGFDIDAGRDDLSNFEIGKEFGITTLKDADGNMHDIALSDYDVVIQEIKQNGLNLYQTKWNKEQEINNLLDVDACILYEATPYEVTIDVVDETGTPTGETQVVTKYKNNVTEW